MTRRKPPQGVTEAHIRLPLAMLDSHAYIALSWTARSLYVDLRYRLRSTNNGNINAAFSELVHRGWNSSATLAKCLRELEAAGLIRPTRKTVGVEHGSKVCNLYRFTDLEVFARPHLGIESSPATKEYAAFTTLAEARRAVRQARPTKPRAPAKKKTTLQKLKRDASKNEAMGEIDASEFEVKPKSQLQNLKRQKTGETAGTRTNAGFAAH